MTKVAIKNENITSFGGFYHLWTFFQSWALKNLVNQYWANVEVSARHSVMEIFLFSFPSLLRIWFSCLYRNQEL